MITSRSNLGLVLLFAAVTSLSAQTNIFPSSGNVGVGTTTPASLLANTATNRTAVTDGAGVAAGGVTWASSGGYVMNLNNTGTGGSSNGLLVHTAASSAYSYALAIESNSTSRFVVRADGNVGVGITNPGSKLSIGATTGVASPGSSALGILDGGNPAYGFDFTLEGVATGDMSLRRIVNYASSPMMTFQRATGNVGIGTNNPTQKLAVNGTIRAKEVIVDTGWSDYVFKPDYKLASLSEVEGAIKRDGHLPGIPSAQEVAEHGVSMGDMQAKLLAKIEELTLHQIEHEKHLATQQNEITALRNQLSGISRNDLMHSRRYFLNLVFLLTAVLPVSGQTLYVPSGTSGIGSSSNSNVGIGTSSPPYSLYTSGDIGVASNRQFIARYDNNENYKATLGWSHLQLGNNGSNWIVAGRTATGGALTFIVNNTADYSYGGYNGIEAMTLAASGNVGIGTTSPSSELHIVAGTKQDVTVYLPAAAAGISDFRVGGVGWVFDRPSDGALTQAIYSYNSATKDNLAISSRSDIVFTAGNGGPSGAPERMRVADNGNVGIGTTNPTQKLSVNGTIQAKEVIVQTGWSDYVFDEGYKLKALSEVEAYVKAEKHLPGFPSAQEVAEHGVSMGAMQSKLLAKIEELTLHQIEQEKQLRALKKQNEELLSRLKP